MAEAMTFEQAVQLLEKEYERAKRLKFVIKPVAYALYQTWKIADKKKRKNG